MAQGFGSIQRNTKTKANGTLFEKINQATGEKRKVYHGIDQQSKLVLLRTRKT